MAAEKQIVLVDMDGVIADFDGDLLQQLPEGTPLVERRSFYLAEDYPDHQAAIATRYNNPAFFEELGVIDDALEGWQRMIDLGYDPVIASAPILTNPRSIEGKLMWLDKHFVPEFGVQVLRRAYIGREKHSRPGIALIDDRSEVLRPGQTAEWQHVVFDQPYNQLSSAAFRLMGWRDPSLGEILDAVAHQHAA